MYQDICHFCCLHSPSLPCSSSSSQESSPEITKKKKKKSTRFTSPHKGPLKTLLLTSPMRKSTKRSIFPASTSPIPCKKSAQCKQRAASQFVDIEREVVSRVIATKSGTTTSVEENDERSMTEVNSRKGGRVFNKEKYPMSDTIRFHLLLAFITKILWGDEIFSFLYSHSKLSL